jgi:uncharacterized protein YlxP (DUF503 family)
MTIGVYSLEFHLPASRSLKDKRQVLRRLKARLRSRFNVAVAELDEFANLWQRAALTLVSVAANRDALVRTFDAALREAESLVPGHVIEAGREFIDGVDAGPDGAWP